MSASSGLIVGFIAGKYRPAAFAGPEQSVRLHLTTVLGIAGAFLATFIGQAMATTDRIRAPDSSRQRSARWWFCHLEPPGGARGDVRSRGE